MTNYSYIIITTSWVWTTEMGISTPQIMTIDEFKNTGELFFQYNNNEDSTLRVKYISDTSISVYRGARSAPVILFVK